MKLFGFIMPLAMLHVCDAFNYDTPTQWKGNKQLAIKTCTTGMEKIVAESENRLKSQMDSLINWLEKCVAEPLGFIRNKDNSAWSYVPSFGATEKCDLTGEFCKLGEEVFTNYLMDVAGKVAEKFFKTFSNWEETKSNPNHIFGADWKVLCGKLLDISAARHIYYISILYELSNKAISTCEERNKKYLVPDDYCYPVNYGSLTCTSDEDVGLIGPKAGILVKKFNNYFEEKFNGISSEKVMDTNVYAYSLEYAMPQKFEFQGEKGKQYKEAMENNEKTREWKVEDIVVALYKVKKYDESKFTVLQKQFKDELTSKELKDSFDRKIKALESLSQFFNIGTSEEENLQSYSYLTNSLAYSDTKVENLDRNMKLVLYSLLYAAEAYHSRGTLRVVVGSMQMEKENGVITDRLDTFDFWASMIENWGDSLKVFYNCGGVNLPLSGEGAGKCWLKMSKYMYRFLYSMAKLYHDGNVESSKLLNVDNDKALGLMKSWLEDFKKKGASKIPDSYVSQTQQNTLETGISGHSAKNWRGEFAKSFGCDINGKFSDCIDVINKVVGEYNTKLISYANKKF